MAMAFLTMPTKWATMVIITENLWRNRDLRSDPGATWSSNKHEQKQKQKSITNSTYSHSYYR